MKRLIVLLTIIFGFHLMMMAQKSKSDQTFPKEDIQVNREFDEDGNLIRFDSIYSYSWSGDTTMLQSILPEKFQNLFGDYFDFGADSTFSDNSYFGDLDQLFFSPFSNKRDSISSKSKRLSPFQANPRSMDALMKMLQQQMKEMEEYHRKFFRKQPEWKEF